MDYCNKFAVGPSTKMRLARIDPTCTGKHESHEKAQADECQAVPPVHPMLPLLRGLLPLHRQL